MIGHDMVGVQLNLYEPASSSRNAAYSQQEPFRGLCQSQDRLWYTTGLEYEAERKELMSKIEGERVTISFDLWRTEGTLHIRIWSSWKNS
jgi:hypothetical protein